MHFHKPRYEALKFAFHRKFKIYTDTYIYLPKTKKFGCVGRGDLTLLFFSKVVKYIKVRGDLSTNVEDNKSFTS